jgi:hypothetical protein
MQRSRLINKIHGVSQMAGIAPVSFGTGAIWLEGSDYDS